eukprot:gene31224-35242_t
MNRFGAIVRGLPGAYTDVAPDASAGRIGCTDPN